ncbi:ankyrin repeat protein, partial [Martensiomyces pterosporus]
MGQGDVDAILQMIRSGTSVDIRDSVGRTPLHVACSCGNVAGARLLIHMGADVNATDNVGNTPLTIAATGARSDVVIPLLEGGAD